MIKQDMQLFCELVARDVTTKYDPEFRDFSQRIYRMPHYSSPFSSFVQLLTLGYANLLNPSGDSLHLSSATVGALANAIYRYPFWVVPPAIMELAQQIDPPQDWDLSATTFGLPVINFILPTGFLVGDDGEEVNVLTVMLKDDQLRADCWKQMGLKNAPNVVEKTTLLVQAYSAKTMHLHFIVVEVPDDRIITHEKLLAVPISGNATTPTTTRWTREVMLPLGLTLVALMNSCPEWADQEPKLIKRIRKSKREVWTPRILGQHYRHKTARTKTSSSLEGHIYRGPVATHWRRGHWHTYRTGPGRQERKLVLVKPVLVNPPGE